MPSSKSPLLVFFKVAGVVLVVTCFVLLAIYYRQLTASKLSELSSNDEPVLCDVIQPPTTANSTPQVPIYKPPEVAKHRRYERILLATMLTDDVDNYARGAMKLITSILRTLEVPSVTFSVLELVERALPSEVKEKLTRAGWSVITVKRIPPRDEDNTYPRFRDQFTKLHFWNLTRFDRVLYLDSDALVVRDINQLLTMNISDKPLWVSRDIRNGVWVETFNMGVFMIRPNRTEFGRLMRLRTDKSVKFETTMSEQGFLNVVYKDQWGEIGFVNNANLAAYTQDRQKWDKYDRDINVIHFTMEKPWSGCSSAYAPICAKWDNVTITN